MTKRRAAKEVRIGTCTIGGDHPVAIQSMTNTRTADVTSTVAQIRALEDAGCDIIRCAVPAMEDAEAISRIREEISIPLVADIHFDYRLAIASIEHGADKIRINPGNIGDPQNVRKVAECARAHGVPIRVGVNAGSLEKDLLEKYGGIRPEALAESAVRNVDLLRSFGAEDLVVSIKASDVLLCTEAYECFAAGSDLPLHIGITEAGTLSLGTIKSAAGLSILLAKGIGDTLRVSLTADPVEEVRTAKLILRSLGLLKKGIELVACPTCGRTRIDLIDLADRTEQLVAGYDLPIKVAVMGCVVNGPGEAKDADLGICGGEGCGLLIRHGEVLAKLPEEELLPALKHELDHWTE